MVSSCESFDNKVWCLQISRLGRQEQGLTGEWSTVKIPGPGHHQIQLESSWTLTNLTSSSSYECIIQVRFDFEGKAHLLLPREKKKSRGKVENNKETVNLLFVSLNVFSRQIKLLLLTEGLTDSPYFLTTNKLSFENWVPLSLAELGDCWLLSTGCLIIYRVLIKRMLFEGCLINTIVIYRVLDKKLLLYTGCLIIYRVFDKRLLLYTGCLIKKNMY